MFHFAKKMPSSYNKYNFGGRIIRIWCAKHILEKCGKGINIDSEASIGENVSLGDNSGIGRGAVIYSNVNIGNNVMMGPEVFIITVNHKFDEIDIPMNKQGVSPIQPVIIEDDVWIGARVIILPGVKVGTGSIIGAGAVVSKNVEPYSVMVGVPAKLIKKRK